MPFLAGSREDRRPTRSTPPLTKKHRFPITGGKRLFVLRSHLIVHPGGFESPGPSENVIYFIMKNRLQSLRALLLVPILALAQATSGPGCGERA
jgi:hypothetical protein